MDFLTQWHRSSLTSMGLFWMALWAFGFGYLISSMIQVFVSTERMKRSLGNSGFKETALATLFGFISSSCSFAALSTSRALFAKGSGFIPALAFLLASTNLVVELGIVIAIFLSWQFVWAEYLGGILLILICALMVKLTYPKELIESGRKSAQKHSSSKEDRVNDWRKLIVSKEGWLKVSQRYLMEWQMVWDDVLIGFTVAGIIAIFVPPEFFKALFLNLNHTDPSFFDLVYQAVIGPVAAVFTFIGSMGNIPLAAVLFSNGVSFAGIVAFIFSDLIVVPVLRIQASYYGWRLTSYIAILMLVAIVAASVTLHYGFDFFDLLPSPDQAKSMTEREFFDLDMGFVLNCISILISFIFFRFAHAKPSNILTALKGKWLAMACIIWHLGGIFSGLLISKVSAST